MEPDPERMRSYAAGIEFDWHGIDGRVWKQKRPDDPGDGPKYVFGKGETPLVGIPRGMEDAVLDVARPLLIVEGTKQHLVAAQHADGRYAVVGIAGCQMWRSGGKPLPDWRSIPLADRKVYLCFDADWQTNRDVWEAAKELSETLSVKFRARAVHFMVLPSATDKTGLDDFMLDEPDKPGALRHLVESATPKLGRAPRRQRDRGAFFDGSGSLRVVDLALHLVDNYPLAISPDHKVVGFRDGYYRNGQSKEFARVVRDILGNDWRILHQESVTDVVHQELEHRGRFVPVFQERLLVPFRNGLVDPLTMSLHPHDPDFMTLWCVPHDFDPDARAPLFEQWLASSTHDPAALLEVTATMLDPTRAPTKSLMLYGPSRSGKSTFLRLAQQAVGRQNCSAVTLHQMSDDHFAAADLLGKRLNVAADLSAREVRDLSLFKMLTGGDPVQANQKWGKRFQLHNQALMAFSTNDVPAVSESSRAYFERVYPVPFPKTFAGAESHALEPRLAAEMPGILNLLLRALADLVRRGYAPQRPDDAVTRDFERRSDRVRLFLDTETVSSPRPDGTPRDDLFAAYRRWCEANGYRTLGKIKFYERVRSAGVQEYRSGTGGTGPRCFEVLVDPDAAEPVPELPESSLLTPMQTGDSKCSEANWIRSSPDSGNSGSETGAEMLGRLADALPLFTEYQRFSLDVETDGLQAGCTVRSLQLAWSDDDVIVLSDRQTLASALQTLASADVELFAYNGDFDRRAIRGDFGIDLPIVDVAPLHHVYNAAQATGRDPLKAAMKERGWPVAMTGADTIGLDVDDPAFIAYAANDATALFRLEQVWRTTAERMGLDVDAFLEREAAVRQAAERMTARGIRIDTAERDRLAAEYAAERDDHLATIERLSPGLNPLSGKQVREALEARGIELPVVRRKKRDGSSAWSPSAGRKALRSDDELVLAIQGARRAASTAQTLGKQWQAGPDGRIHPRYRTLGARSGRWSSSGPNLQNVAKHGDALRLRSAFVPEPGNVFVQADLSQIEYRVAAAYSGDPSMLRAFAESGDLHVHAAKVLFGRDEPTKADRSIAKGIGFGKLYGQRPRQTAEAAGVPLEEMLDRIEAYDAEFPALKAWCDDVVGQTEARALRTPANLYGRQFRVAAAYQAVNYLCQSAARDVFCDWLLAVDDAHPGSIVAAIHDELLLEVPLEAADDVVRSVVDLAAGLPLNGVPVVAEAAGPLENWMQAYV